MLLALSLFFILIDGKQALVGNRKKFSIYLTHHPPLTLEYECN